jgi:gliding motility-associated-like protein
LNLTPSTGGTWTSSDASVASITNGGVVTGVSVGTADMTFTNTTTGCSSAGSTGTIIVNESPTITVPTANAICEGSTLNLQPTTGGLWSSNDASIATITNGGEVTGVSQGTTEMVFTDTATGCSSIASTGTIIVNTTPTLTTGAINCDKPTSSYSVGYTTDAGATVTASVGSVTPTAVTGVPNDQQVVITATSVGCPSTSETVSTDECEDVIVDVSNGVSPNSDGLNDFFEVTNLDAYPGNGLSIFNRWGDKVYELSPYMNEWNGQNNVGGLGGEELPAGTYFYILELGEDQDPIKGYIELKR